MPLRSRSAGIPAGTVYFVRHGLVHNPNRVAYGWLPRYRLAEEGRAQAAATAAFLADRGGALILTSPLLRAVQTTRILAARLPGVPVLRSRLLIESGLARHWQGESWTEIPLKYPEAWALFQQTPGALDLGEPMAAMATRLRRAMARALQLSGGRPSAFRTATRSWRCAWRSRAAPSTSCTRPIATPPPSP